MGIRRFQFMLLAIGLALAGTFRLLRGHMGALDVLRLLIFTFIVGNCAHFAALVTAPVYTSRRFPWDVLLLWLTLIPAGFTGGYVTSMVVRLVAQRGTEGLFDFPSSDILQSIFFWMVISVPTYLSRKTRNRLESRNRELESQVTLGQIELKAQEAELKAANEIQSHLLPREIPRVKG